LPLDRTTQFSKKKQTQLLPVEQYIAPAGNRMAPTEYPRQQQAVPPQQPDGGRALPGGNQPPQRDAGGKGQAMAQQIGRSAISPGAMSGLHLMRPKAQARENAVA
jgi:hypothetical protein